MSKRSEDPPGRTHDRFPANPARSRFPRKMSRGPIRAPTRLSPSPCLPLSPSAVGVPGNPGKSSLRSLDLTKPPPAPQASGPKPQVGTDDLSVTFRFLRFACPDLATARYLRVFARIGCTAQTMLGRKNFYDVYFYVYKRVNQVGFIG